MFLELVDRVRRHIGGTTDKHAHADLTGLTTGDPHTQYPTQVEYDDHSARHDSGGADVLAADAAAGTASLRSLGTGATTAAAGNDSRLSDARTPSAHATTHKGGGADVIDSASVTVAGLESAQDKMLLTVDPTANITGAVTLTFTSVGATLIRRLTGNVSITLAAPVAGWYALRLRQDGTGSRTITFTTTVNWSGGTVPTWTTTLDKADFVNLFYDGASWSGQSSLNHAI